MKLFNTNVTVSSVLFQQMRDASEKRKELEQLRTETIKKLREKQLSVKNETNFAEKAKSMEQIEALQSKIRELEKKTELQNVRHEELMIEMAAIKKTQSKLAYHVPSVVARETFGKDQTVFQV